MYEIDFLAIEKTGSAGSKSGDAIPIRFTDPDGVERVVVIDGGYKDTGERLVDHVRNMFGTSHVDLVISTHPDADHINGLATVLDELDVDELLIHRPHLHAPDVSDYSNIEVIDALIGLAEDTDVIVTEPFTGLERFGGALRILGPTEAYYSELLADDLAKATSGTAALTAAITKRLTESSFAHGVVDLLSRALAFLPTETLGEDGETSPRNSTSVITLLTIDGNRLLLTGDAGVDALNRASEEYEAVVGEFAHFPLRFFQAPHHGSRRNLAPSLLNRIFGKAGDTFGTPTSFISSAKADPKHPSPKVTNALKRRNVRVFATEGQGICHSSGVDRPGWVPVTEVPALDEDDD